MKPWPKVRLGEVLKPISREEKVDPSKEYRLLGVRLEGQGPFLRETVNGTQTAASKLFRVQKGDFIYSRLFAWRGAFGVIPDDLDGCYVSGEFPTFNALPERIDAFFLRYWFRLPATIARVDENCSGSTPLTRNRFKEHFFLSLEIPLPPLQEQQRIVARIQELSRLIDEARAFRHQAVEQAEALTSSAWSALSNLESVEKISISDLVGETGLRNGKSVKSAGEESSIHCLALSAMRNGRIDIHDSKPVPMSPEEAAAFQVRKGDVYVVRGNGSKALCGRAGFVDDDSSGVIFPDLFIKVSLPAEKILPAFFVATWNSPAVRSMIEEKAKTTSGIWKINQGHILSTHVPIPPISEQHCIVAELQALQMQVDIMKTLQSETAVELGALLPAILDRAFRGELT
jgi:type I restriction enzyme, S subunit